MSSEREETREWKRQESQREEKELSREYAEMENALAELQAKHDKLLFHLRVMAKEWGQQRGRYKGNKELNKFSYGVECCTDELLVLLAMLEGEE